MTNKSVQNLVKLAHYLEVKAQTSPIDDNIINEMNEFDSFKEMGRDLEEGEPVPVGDGVYRFTDETGESFHKDDLNSAMSMEEECAVIIRDMKSNGKSKDGINRVRFILKFVNKKDVAEYLDLNAL